MKINPDELYRRLYSYYGPQGWWPLIFSNTDDKEGYYRKLPVHEKTAEEKFEIITGAVLTQNVNWGNVYKCLVNLKNNNILTPHRFLEENPERIKNDIKPSCYYNQKYKKLYSLITYLLQRNYFDKNIPDRRELLSLSGVGEETADSILLYAYNRKFFVIDEYTKRLSNRLAGKILFKKYSCYQKYYADNIPDDVNIYNEFHALIVKHSVEKCRSRNPDCGNCVLADLCRKQT